MSGGSTYQGSKSRNKNNRNAQSNFLADYANNRRKRINKLFKTKVKHNGTIYSPSLF